MNPKPLSSKLSYIVALAIISSAFLGCQQSRNGTYLVYSITRQWGNDTIVTYLQQQLQGKRFNISFDDKYVIMTNTVTHKETILSRQQRNRELIYNLSYKKGSGEYQISLAVDSILRLRASLRFPRDEPIMIPAQGGGAFTQPFHTGEITAYLTKTTN